MKILQNSSDSKAKDSEASNAAQMGPEEHFKIFKKMLKDNPELMEKTDEPDSNGLSALHYAAAQGFLKYCD